MKKVTTMCLAVIFACFMFTSCGNSPKSDAKKMATIQCEMKGLIIKALTNAEAKEKLGKLTDEAKEISKRVSSKYNAEEQQEFTTELKEATKDCN